MIGVGVFALTLLAAAPRLPACSRVQVPLRARRDRAARPAGAAGDRHDGERRAALGARRAAPVPAGRAREDLPDRLPRGLPAREARGARAGAAEGLGPLLVIWGARDARARRDERPRQRRSSTSGSSSRCSTSRPARFAYVVAGARRSSSSARSASTRSRRTCATASTIWLHPWTTHKVYCPLTGDARPAAGLRGYQLVKSLYSIAQRRLRRHRARQGTFTPPGGHAAHPVPEHRLHLLGARAGARADRRRRRCCSSTCSSSRAGCAIALLARRRLLEAARRRADVRLRAADVHHRRRDPRPDPADRDHAAVRLLRRLERRRELRPARGAAARLEPRERARGAE